MDLFAHLERQQSQDAETQDEDDAHRPDHEIGVGEQFAAHFRHEDRIAEPSDRFFPFQRIQEIEGEGQFAFQSLFRVGVDLSAVFAGTDLGPEHVPAENQQGQDGHDRGRDQEDRKRTEGRAAVGGHGQLVGVRIQQVKHGVERTETANRLEHAVQVGQQIGQQCGRQPGGAGKEQDQHIVQQHGRSGVSADGAARQPQNAVAQCGGQQQSHDLEHEHGIDSAGQRADRRQRHGKQRHDDDHRGGGAKLAGQNLKRRQQRGKQRRIGAAFPFHRDRARGKGRDHQQKQGQIDRKENGENLFGAFSDDRLHAAGRPQDQEQSGQDHQIKRNDQPGLPCPGHTGKFPDENRILHLIPPFRRRGK